MPTWDILTTTIPQRHAQLCRLLGCLDKQMQPGVRMLVYRDDPGDPGGALTNGAKMRALTEASDADYVCNIDDDDLVAHDYVPRIMEALQSEPDYVGFPVAYYLDMVPQSRVEHSLKYDRWFELQGLLCRDISHLNPIRRELALMGDWTPALPGNPAGGHGADRFWAKAIRETGLCKTEVWIPDVMYHYFNSTSDNFYSTREYMPVMPGIPSYPWLTVIKGS